MELHELTTKVKELNWSENILSHSTPVSSTNSLPIDDAKILVEQMNALRPKMGAKLRSETGTHSQIDISGIGDFKAAFPEVEINLRRTHGSRYRLGSGVRAL